MRNLQYNNAPAAGTNIPMPSFNPNIRMWLSLLNLLIFSCFFFWLCISFDCRSNNANYPSIPSTPITAEAKYAVEPLSKNNQEQFRPNGAPISGAQNARCCISPLPESIAQRLQSSKVNDRHVKPCRPAMFRFYMVPISPMLNKYVSNCYKIRLWNSKFNSTQNHMLAFINQMITWLMGYSSSILLLIIIRLRKKYMKNLGTTRREGYLQFSNF